MFTVSEEVRLELRQSEERLADGGKTVIFDLERPVSVTGDKKAIALEFEPGLALARLVLEYNGSVVVETELQNAAGGGSTEYRLPLKIGAKFDRFSVTLPQPAMETRLMTAGIEDQISGIYLDAGIVIDTRIRGSIVLGNESTTYSFDISEITPSLAGMTQIHIRYDYLGSRTTKRPIRITAQAQDKRAVFGLRPRIGGADVYLYDGMFGFVPESIEMEVVGAGFTLRSLTVDSVARSMRTGGIPAPIPADLGALIGYDSGKWRRDDYELFSWNLYPEILIVDTATYAIQSEFFKRLAFFVEKSDSAGSLVSDGYLEDKHGWNAHDYRAEDLARFFARAKLEKFPLGDRERHLLEILIETGIIRAEGSSYSPGVGGLISLSQESTSRLRSLFMMHEGYHGVFFSDRRFAEAVYSIWGTLSELEKEFWHEFLLLRNYNVEDGYLVINEFMAYLMQVSADRLDAYYWDYTVPGLAAYVPRTLKLIEDLKGEHPDTFHRSAAAIEEALVKFAGIGAEDLFCLERIE